MPFLRKAARMDGLTEAINRAEEAIPHIDAGLGKPCGCGDVNRCSTCWARAYFAMLKKSITFIRDWNDHERAEEPK